MYLGLGFPRAWRRIASYSVGLRVSDSGFRLGWSAGDVGMDWHDYSFCPAKHQVEDLLQEVRDLALCGVHVWIPEERKDSACKICGIPFQRQR